MTDSPPLPQKPEDPPGVVLVFLDEEGHAVTHAADFNLSGYGGFKLHEAQRHRAMARLSNAVMSAYASPKLARAFRDSYHSEQVLQRLVQDHGCRVHTIYVGHEGKRHDYD